MTQPRTSPHVADAEAWQGRASLARSRSLGRRSRGLRRRRRIAGVVRFAVFLLLIFVAVWAGVRVAHAGEDGSLYTGHSYTVQAGDSLWSIAAGEYGASADLRRATFEIRKANDLSSDVLQPGEDITLPYLGD